MSIKLLKVFDEKTANLLVEMGFDYVTEFGENEKGGKETVYVFPIDNSLHDDGNCVPGVIAEMIDGNHEYTQICAYDNTLNF